jgi:hypothetical protein
VLITSGRRCPDMTFKDPKEAFNEAVEEGRLSRDKGAENYVGLYMYMGTNDGKDLFKNIITREYLK